MDFHFKASEVIQDKIKGLKFGLVYCQGFRVGKDDSYFDDSFKRLEGFLKDKFSNKRPVEDENVKAVRRMYGKVGWEPTRYRPSSEALVRRILQGKGLYRINNMVDGGNLASARFHIPMGLYDTSKIKGEISIDLGKEEESYRGIGKPEIHAEGKLVLRDDQGIFGNPTADSLRTSIQPETQNALALFFCPPEISEDYISQTLDFLADYYRPFCVTGEIEQEIVKL